VAVRRHHRWVGARVSKAWLVERRFPIPCPTSIAGARSGVTKDGFVRVGDVDYSVPPDLAGRRLQVSRSALAWAGASTTSAGTKLRACRAISEPSRCTTTSVGEMHRSRLPSGDVEVPPVDLTRYDALARVGA